MKCFLLLSFVVISFGLAAQKTKNQLGVRIGDPVGITFKTFKNEKTAFEFGLGTSGSSWNPRYYEKSFIHEYYKDVPDAEFQSHSLKDVLYAQAKYLVYNPIVWSEVPGKWEWYWGVGITAKTALVTYRYNQYYVVDGKVFVAQLEGDVRDYDFGPDGTIGFEYSFNDVPLSIGYDFSVMLELYDRTGPLRAFTGLSFRYNL